MARASKYLIILLLFISTRLITAWGFEYRQVEWLNNDPGGYVATAQYIEQHGSLPTEDKIIYRQYPGLPLLMVGANFFIGNLVVAGYLVVTVCALGFLFLVQHLFDDFRLSLISCVFLPYWITATTTIFSEAPAAFCFLIGVWALRNLQRSPLLFALALMVAGFAIVVRQNAALYLLPCFFLLGWKCSGGGLGRALAATGFTLVPVLLYLVWNWLTIHQLFPQARLHRETLLISVASHADPQRYSLQLFDFPLKSLAAGLTDPSERLGKRLSVLGTLFVVAAALIRLNQIARGNWEPNQKVLANAFFAALLLHLGFLVCLGGDFGYKWLDRHLSQLNLIIDWALFYRRPLRWPGILILIGAGVIFAIATGEGRPFGIFK